MFTWRRSGYTDRQLVLRPPPRCLRTLESLSLIFSKSDSLGNVKKPKSWGFLTSGTGPQSSRFTRVNRPDPRNETPSLPK